MKKLNYLFIVAISCLIGCNDQFLNRVPKDANTEATYWNTPSDLKTYANQFYDTFEDADVSSTIYPDDQSDNQIPQNKNNYTWNNIPVPSTGGGWDWTTIRDLNYFMQRYDQVKGDSTEINNYVAEVRFFRAREYFLKVVRFGNVPYYDKDLNIDSKDSLYKSRDSRTSVMRKVMKDLDFAIDHLPDSPENGRIGKYAAAALKSRAALFEGTFEEYQAGTSTYKGIDNSKYFLEESVHASELIINSKKFSISHIDANPKKNYEDLFIQNDLSTNEEGIHVRKYTSQLLTHNLPRQINESQDGLSKKIIQSYLCSNGLPIYYNGSKNTLFQGDTLLSKEIKNRDPRLKQTIWYPNKVWNITRDQNEIKREQFPSFINQTTGYVFSKFRSPYAAQRDYNLSDIDFFVYRYAEVLLNYAEAKAELGQANQTVLDVSINKIRDRVNLPHMISFDGINVGSAKKPGVQINSSDSWPDYGYTLSPLLYEIRRERNVELVMEGFRFTDIVRWRAGEILNDPIAILGIRISDNMKEKYESQLMDQNVNDDNLLEVYPGARRDWNNKLYLHPIPTNQLTLNDNLTQNPGW